MKIILCFIVTTIIVVSCSHAIQQKESKSPIDSNSNDSLLAYYQTFEREHILVKVDSIIVPTSIKNGDRFIAKFYGKISNGGCAQLDSVVQTTTFLTGNFVKRESIRFYATRITDRRAVCAAATVTLGGYGGNPYIREFLPTNRGEFIISVQQPDSTVLEKIIYVD